MLIPLQTLGETLAVILAGGVGSRLHPLTADRAKPAVPFGGVYRIIDFTLSNCLHSGLRRILVLTQYKSHSLHQHLRDGWSIFNPELGEFITVVPAQMRTGAEWYAGTADAIYQNRYLLERHAPKYVLILCGDHVYRMDYARMLEEHVEREFDVTVACMPVPLDRARSCGVMEVDRDLRVRSFEEKPENPLPMPEDPTHARASLGIYVFNLPFLLQTLAQDNIDKSSSHDFGKNILPHIIISHRVGAYRFGGMKDRVAHDGYWRDVGTLDAYYEANMDLLKPIPPINLYQKDWPVRTYQGQYPGARTAFSSSGEPATVTNTILAGGDIIVGGRVIHSILSPDVRIDEEAMVRDSILFQGVRIGAEARLKRCIVDKNILIPPKESIGYNPDSDRERFTVSEGGVVVVAKGYRFPAS